MAQHDYVIANDTAANVRSDLNDALSAIVSQNSGAIAPSTTYAYMLWPDTANNILKMRSEADDAWINVGYLDQAANAFRILDDTQVVNTSGTQTGLLGDQTEATWETGTSTTESLVSPAKVKAAIDANGPESPVKAWVNFDGTTATIRDSFNVSSLVDNGAGDFTVNFTNALPNANFSAVVSATDGSEPRYAGAIAYTTGSVRVKTESGGGNNRDYEFTNLIVAGD